MHIRPHGIALWITSLDKAGVAGGPALIAAAKGNGIPSLTDAALEANAEELLRLDRLEDELVHGYRSL